MYKHLHIVCFDVPYPVDHGGFFDVFYKITALHKMDVKIYLHCFEYGRGRQQVLENYCEKVYYYKRLKGISAFSFSIPYIVYSRRNPELLNNLLKDDHPVLLEGIHCTYYLFKNLLRNRKVFVRLHNIESEYYAQLSASSSHPAKKIFFLRESRLLKKYELAIASKATFIGVSPADKDVYEKMFHAADVRYLPVFLPFNAISATPGIGTYCLYHGNLQIAENEKAVTWLLKNVFHTLKVPFVIAGKNPSKQLHALTHQSKHTCLIANPTNHEMAELLQMAHINILPSFNNTGIKLKILNALFNGRYCMVNEQAVSNSGLESLCYICSDAGSFRDHISGLLHRSFSDEDKEPREHLLLQNYDAEKNARKLIQWIY